MREFIEFANENNKGISAVVGAVGTAVICGVYVYVGVALVRNFTAEKRMKQMLADLEALAAEAQVRIDASKAEAEEAATDEA